MIEEHKNVIAYGGRLDDADKVEPDLLRVVEAFRATARSRRAGDPSSLPRWLTEEDMGTFVEDADNPAPTYEEIERAYLQLRDDPYARKPPRANVITRAILTGAEPEEHEYVPPSAQDTANARRSVQRTLRAAAKRMTQGEPMDTRTGEVAAMRVFEKELSRVDIERYVRPIDPANLTPRAQATLRASGRAQISRNSPCPCGSRKRFKRCHMTTP